MPAVCSQKISAVSGETLSLLAGSGRSVWSDQWRRFVCMFNPTKTFLSK